MGKIQVFVISNTHWDREWYMPLEKYMIRLVKLFDRLVAVMEKNPEYRFVTDGQYIIVEDYLRVRPEMGDRIKKLIGEGRLKVGPWYTQPLETLITGEAMVRNLYYGITETEKLGAPMLFGYMIDEFGHASQMPQVYKGFGIDDAMAWRGIENKAKDVFEWAAPNGDTVLMHRSPRGYGDAVAMPECLDDYRESVDGHIFDRRGLRGRIERIKFLKDDISQTGAQFWLNGVDHSWAQENILEVIDTINREFPEYSVKQSTLEEYAECVRKAYKNSNIAMQKYEGELMHPDEQILVCAHSCRADQKQRHWLAERILEKRAEPMSAAAWLFGYDYPLWALRDSWKYILENHAHDSLDCCSVDEVYERVMSRYASSISLSEQLADDAFAYLMSAGGGGGNVLYVFNTNSSDYEGLVSCSFDAPDSLLPGGFDITDRTAGEKIDFAVLSAAKINKVRYNAFFGHPSRIPGKRFDIVMDAGKIDGFSMKSFILTPKTDNRESITEPPAENVFENEFYFIEIKPNGCIDATDKISGFKYYDLLQIADCGDCGNIWQFKIPENNETITNANVGADIKKLEENALMTEYEIKYALDIPEGYDFGKKSRSSEKCPMDVKIKLRLLKKTRYIGVEIELENRSRFHQVRLLLPAGITADAQKVRSVSGQPFDVVERKLGAPEGFDFNTDPNCEYHPMQDFCAVTDGSRGLMAAAKGIYEYEAVNGENKTLALTLLRSAKFEDDDDCVGGYNMQKSYMLQKIKYELAVIPFSGGWRERYPDVLGYINPPAISFGRDTDEAALPGYVKPGPAFPGAAQFIRLKGKDVYITAVKREENGENLLVRAVSFAEEKQNVSVEINKLIPCKESRRFSLKEIKGDLISKGGTAEFEIMPKQIVTIGFEKQSIKI